jgi:hydroxymethylbilane synthase
VGLEIRRGDPVAEHICLHLDHVETRQCVTAERAFLHAMGGGCQAPIAAYAEVRGDGLRLQVISFRDGPPRQADVSGPVAQALELGRQLAAKFLAGGTPGRPAGT